MRRYHLPRELQPDGCPLYSDDSDRYRDSDYYYACTSDSDRYRDSDDRDRRVTYHDSDDCDSDDIDSDDRDRRDSYSYDPYDRDLCERDVRHGNAYNDNSNRCYDYHDIEYTHDCNPNVYHGNVKGNYIKHNLFDMQYLGSLGGGTSTR